MNSHNPYFSRWFSAISSILQQLKLNWCHNPYFSRWFSAILKYDGEGGFEIGHNPYFSRWFSAILTGGSWKILPVKSQSLF